jgi:hypothetical protein
LQVCHVWIVTSACNGQHIITHIINMYPYHDLHPLQVPIHHHDTLKNILLVSEMIRNSHWNHIQNTEVDRIFVLYILFKSVEVNLNSTIWIYYFASSRLILKVLDCFHDPNSQPAHYIPSKSLLTTTMLPSQLTTGPCGLPTDSQNTSGNSRSMIFLISPASLCSRSRLT